MLFTGEHETTWRFDRPVFLEPHLVRLFPRQDGAQDLESFRMRVAPEPVGFSDILDADGNQARWIWFEGLHETLTITTIFTARTLRRNPFDFLLAPDGRGLPPALPEAERAVLVPCLAPVPDSEPAAALAREVDRATGGDTLAFLGELNARLHRDLCVSARFEPGIQPPRQTLALGGGACRDAALVFIAACRSAGVPARFLSCYQGDEPDRSEHDLHACAEVYLPGAGWRGFDPTLGLAVADTHLALCASPVPELTAPVTGTFRGTDARGRLFHHIDLTVRA